MKMEGVQNPADMPRPKRNLDDDAKNSGLTQTQITWEASDRLDAVYKGKALKYVVVSGAVKWFLSQPPAVRRAVLDDVTDMGPEYAATLRRYADAIEKKDPRIFYDYEQQGEAKADPPSKPKGKH